MGWAWCMSASIAGWSLCFNLRNIRCCSCLCERANRILATYVITNHKPLILSSVSRNSYAVCECTSSQRVFLTKKCCISSDEAMKNAVGFLSSLSSTGSKEGTLLSVACDWAFCAHEEAGRACFSVETCSTILHDILFMSWRQSLAIRLKLWSIEERDCVFDPTLAGIKRAFVACDWAFPYFYARPLFLRAWRSMTLLVSASKLTVLWYMIPASFYLVNVSTFAVFGLYSAAQRPASALDLLVALWSSILWY